MADPLNIAASIAGLIAITGRIASAIKTVTSSVALAPLSVTSAFETVMDIKLALILLKDLLDEIATLPRERKAMIQLDHITITFTHYVKHSFRARVRAGRFPNTPFRLRLWWAFNAEDRVTELLPRLESQKSSLSSMISVLECKSDTHALNDCDRPFEVIKTIVEQNEGLSRPLQSLGSTYTDYFQPDSANTDDDALTIHPQRCTTSTIPELSHLAPKKRNSFSAIPIRHEIENRLSKSQVCSRLKEPDSVDHSCRGSTIITAAARSSILSMVSLNNMSITAVFRLPIRLRDVSGSNPGDDGTTLCTKGSRSYVGHFGMERPDKSHNDRWS
ncbi:hypothetical protein B0T14DRAFT_569047 [Immersiella caudata]|uniref:Fungal N-terminal domain-containing protein n=1 Tax=Immersiella caudata TaxID=314043 RepID=A0AA40BXM7_9PEZI|nr:hypothetical protein B0T14DRAFT_569047 [Immersiella caudata]